jgi:hypothetical protein
VTARFGVLSWGWREQPDWDALGKLVADFSDGRVHLRNVDDTDSNQYAIVVSTEPLDAKVTAEAYRRALANWEQS